MRHGGWMWNMPSPTASPSAARIRPSFYANSKEPHLSRFIRVVLVLIIVLAALIWLYPPARLFALAAAGRSPVCSVAEAVKSDENLKRQIAYKDQILAASKLVQ